MRRWIRKILGRWVAKRIRTKKQDDLYRTIIKNQETLEKGGSI